MNDEIVFEDDEKRQVEAIASELTYIHIPAGDGYREIEMYFTGPVSRIARHLYRRGVRVLPPELLPKQEEGGDDDRADE